MADHRHKLDNSDPTSEPQFGGAVANQRAELARALAIGTFGILLLNALVLLLNPFGTTHWPLWEAVAINHAIMLPLALLSLGRRCKQWLKPDVRVLLLGIVWGCALLLATVGLLSLMKWLNPNMFSYFTEPIAMKDLMDPKWALALLILPIIPGEEIVWRGAVMLPLAERFGKAAGVAVAALMFAAAHLTLGSVPLLLAAVALGAFWGIITLWTRSLVPALVCHLIWDVMMLYVVKL